MLREVAGFDSAMVTMDSPCQAEKDSNEGSSLFQSLQDLRRFVKNVALDARKCESANPCTLLDASEQTEETCEVWGDHGRRFKRTPNGAATYEHRPCETLTAVARDLLIQAQKTDPTVRIDYPTTREAVKDIAIYNNIKDPDFIGTSSTLVIPPHLVPGAKSNVA